MLVTENGQHIGVLDTENLGKPFLIKGKIKTSLCLKLKSTIRPNHVYSEDYFSQEQIIQNVQYEFIIFNFIF
jgi:hypothetical protein